MDDGADFSANQVNPPIVPVYKITILNQMAKYRLVIILLLAFQLNCLISYAQNFFCYIY